MVAIGVVAVQFGAARYASGVVDVISLGMAVLAGMCAVRTLLATPAAGTMERWRWHAATLGWAIWTVHWGANTVEALWLGGDQTLANALVVARRAAFVVALVPLATSDARAFRWLDAAQGLIFALLLALLSWPGLLSSGAIADPDRRYLYLGYAAMATLAGISLAAHRASPMRGLVRAIFCTFLGYAATGISARELYEHRVLDLDSPVFVYGGLVFVAYLALLPATARGDHASPDRTSPDPAPSGIAQRQLSFGRLVPLFLVVLIFILGISVAGTSPTAGIIGGVAALIVYAARTTLTENLLHSHQQASIDAERARAEMMVDMMHEVRSPLAVVALNASMLSRGANMDQRERTMCHAINAGCMSVARLLDDVLMLERIEAGLTTATIAPHDVAAIVRHVATLLAATADDYGVTLDIPDAPLIVQVDAMAVERILVNLVGNALRFTPHGGSIRVSFQRGRDGAVAILVADSGTGMSAEVQALLFRRFATVGQPVNGARGTGLGLSISLALARTMGGVIESASVEGSGTTMTLHIPRADPDYTGV